MATNNKDFRVKNGLYVGENVDALRGSVSADKFYGCLFTLSAGGVNGSGLDVVGGQDRVSFNATNGINTTIVDTDPYIRVDLNLNVDTNQFQFNSGKLSISPSTLSSLSALDINGGYDGGTGISLTSAGDISATGNVFVNGSISANELFGDGRYLTTNVRLSAGGDVSGTYVDITDLDGTYSLDLQLGDTGVVSGVYGSATTTPILTIDNDGRVVSAAESSIASILSTCADTGTGTINLLTQQLTIGGTTGEIETSSSGQNITIGLPDDVAITGTLTISGDAILDSSGCTVMTFNEGDATFRDDVIINGDLTVLGNTTQQEVSSLAIEDPVIFLATNNVSADNVDIGFCGQYYDGSNVRYTGLIRDVTFGTGMKPYVFYEGACTDFLSAFGSGVGKPSVNDLAPVYMGRLGINTCNYNAGYRALISGTLSSTAIETVALTAGNLRLNDLSSGTDDTVVIIDSNGDIKTRELDSRSWSGGSLVDGTGAVNRVAFWSDSNTLSSDASLYWNPNSNRLGINTSSPSYDLHVQTSGGTTGAYFDQVLSGAGSQILFTNCDNTLGFRVGIINGTSGDAFIYNQDNTRLLIYTNATRRLIIGCDGNVNIGTNQDPTEKLTIEGNLSACGCGIFRAPQTTTAWTNSTLKLRPRSITNNTGLTNIALGTSTSDNYGYTLNAWRCSTTDCGSFTIKSHKGTAAGTDVLTIDTNGCVGIGTTQPSGYLEVPSISGTIIFNKGTNDRGWGTSNSPYIEVRGGSDTASESPSLVLRNECTNTDWGIHLDSADNDKLHIRRDSAYPSMTFCQNGQIGIGTTSIGSTLINIRDSSGYGTTMSLNQTVTGLGAQTLYTNCYNTLGFRVGLINGTSGNAFVYNQGDTNILFYTSATLRMSMTSGGDVTIGGCTEFEPVSGGRVLHVGNAQGSEVVLENTCLGIANDTYIGGYLFKSADISGDPPHYSGIAAFSDSLGQMSLNFYGDRANFETNTPDITITCDSTVGIGKTNPGEKLSVSGNIALGSAEEAVLQTNQVTVTQSSSAVVLDFPYAEYRSGKIQVQADINSSTQFEVSELLVVHDNTDTYQTEYGSITTGSSFCVTYTTRIDGSNFELIACNNCATAEATVIGTIIRTT